MEKMEEDPFFGVAAYAVRGIKKTSYFVGHYDERTGILRGFEEARNQSEAIRRGRFIARSMGMSFIWLSEEQEKHE